MSFSGFHHRNLCISSRTLSVYGLLSLTLSNIWATAMPTFDTIYQRGILAGIFEFSFFLFEAGQCCLWALIHEALAKMLRFYGMEQSFTSLESTESIAEDVGRASWLKACDISALLVIWYPEGHEVLLTRIFHRFAVVERRFAKSFFLFCLAWTHLSLLALVCCFLPRWSIDRSTNGECISSMMIQLTLSRLLLRASSSRKTPPYSSKWGILAVVQPYATHAPMYSTILIQDLGKFIPRLLVDLYLCSLRPSLPLQEFILVLPSWGWHQRSPVDDEHVFQRAVDTGRTFAAVVRCWLFGVEKCFPIASLAFSIEAEMVEGGEESWERTGALLMAGRCSGGYM